MSTMRERVIELKLSGMTDAEIIKATGANATDVHQYLRTFVVGQLVNRKQGYGWPGIVVSVFKTQAGLTRIVVECTVAEVKGALHIYAPENLEHRSP